MIVYDFSLFYISAKLNLSRLLIFKGLIFWRGWAFYSFLTGHFSLLSEGLYCHWSFFHWIVSFLLIHALNIKESIWSYYMLNLVGIGIYIQKIEVKLFSISTINWKSYLLNTVFIPLLIWSNIIWICQLLSHVLTCITLLHFFFLEMFLHSFYMVTIVTIMPFLSQLFV